MTERGLGLGRRCCLGVLLLALAGCQSMSRQEFAWQALHAVDVAQTLEAARDPCYQESAWVTRQLIGRQPSDGAVLAWGAGTAVLHAWISSELESRGAPAWVQMVWDLGTLGQTAYAVGSNHTTGVRVLGRNQDVPGCTGG
jgi:hypothetical protein